MLYFDSQDYVNIGIKSRIEKSVIAEGLRVSRSVEAYFRFLVTRSWPLKEIAHHSIRGGGKDDLKVLDKDKIKEYVEYTITSWNDYYEKSAKDRIIPPSSFPDKTRHFRQKLAQLCGDINRGIRKGTIKPDSEFAQS